MGRLIRTLFGISPKQTRFEKLKFESGDAQIRQRIEQIILTFVNGYHVALLDDEPFRLAEHLNRTVASEFRGFAFEGAAMGLVIADFLHPFRASGLQSFLDGPGKQHDYIIHIGAGWGLARLPVRFERATANMDPFQRWLAMDGYGFHQGFFHRPRFIDRREEPKHLSAYGRCAFDQGLGRSLWFVKAGHVGRITAAIAEFPLSRRPHLWSGVGLASAYAGGVGRAELMALREACGGFLPQLRQGIAFAAKTRQHAGNPAEWTALACEAVCDSSPGELAAIADEALEGLGDQGDIPAYEVWRQRIQSRWPSYSVF